MYRLIIRSDGRPFLKYNLSSNAEVTAKIEEALGMMEELDKITYDIEVIRETYND